MWISRSTLPRDASNSMTTLKMVEICRPVTVAWAHRSDRAISDAPFTSPASLIQIGELQ
ncbi:hypothetical protein QJS04_geneDACA021409 [Acorus gramineus]|uniref:Uncharacterized protein n=1 Tax=Acorus gramineus TaxID=55184 RepID=A0AAV9A5T2_ACOGR|nr:hypothetical protein QJS04_geneDACA021409 [Acorus gramineus]